MLLPPWWSLELLLLLPTWPGEPEEHLGEFFFPTVEALSGGGFVGLVAGDALLRRVGQDVHVASDGVSAPSPEVTETLTTLVAPRSTCPSSTRFSLAGNGLTNTTSTFLVGSLSLQEHRCWAEATCKCDTTASRGRSTLEVGSHLNSLTRVLPLEGSDGLIDTAVVLQAVLPEFGPRGLLVASSAAPDSGSSSLTQVLVPVVVLLHLLVLLLLLP